jgi:hypothetical protein
LPKDCKLPYLKSKHFENALDISNDDLLRQRFSHSFRYSSNMMNQDKDAGFDTAQEFLKSVIKKNVTIQDFMNFYKGNYNGAGIVNAYLRLLGTF